MVLSSCVSRVRERFTEDFADMCMHFYKNCVKVEAGKDLRKCCLGLPEKVAKSIALGLYVSL